MHRFLSTVAEKVKQVAQRLAARQPAARSDLRARPGVEALEERQLLSASPPLAETARSLIPPTAVTTYHGVSARFLNERVAVDNERIIDIGVEKTSPLKFNATLVKNTGDAAQTSWWYPRLTRAQVDAQMNAHHARILDLQGYTVNGHRRYAAVLVDNTGPDARESQWYSNLTARELQKLTADPSRRIINVESHLVANKKRFDVVVETIPPPKPPSPQLHINPGIINAILGDVNAPVYMEFTDIWCIDDTSEANDDEPYVVTWVGNLKNPGASYATRTTVFEDSLSMDDGDHRYHPNSIWNQAGHGAPIPSSDDLVILTAVLENDSSSPNGVVSTVQAEMLPSLISVLTAKPALSRSELVAKLTADMKGALALGVASGGIDQDEFSDPQELRLTAEKLAGARHHIAQEFFQEFTFDDGDYKIRFEMKG
jgi:hypothetical protein